MIKTRRPNKIFLKKCNNLVYFIKHSKKLNPELCFNPSLNVDVRELEKLRDWINRMIEHKEQK